jgi:regulatory protein
MGATFEEYYLSLFPSNNMVAPLSYEQALARLQRLCSRSEKCMFDVRKKMSDWKITPEDASKIMVLLQSDGFIDELRYAKAFVHDKSNLSKWGILKIRNALRNKKISDIVIDEALLSIDNLTQQKNLAYLLSVKDKSLKALSVTDRKAKLLRFALMRGYDYEMAIEVLNK